MLWIVQHSFFFSTFFITWKIFKKKGWRKLEVSSFGWWLPERYLPSVSSIPALGQRGPQTRTQTVILPSPTPASDMLPLGPFLSEECRHPASHLQHTPDSFAWPAARLNSVSAVSSVSSEVLSLASNRRGYLSLARFSCWTHRSWYLLICFQSCTSPHVSGSLCYC